MSDWSEDEICMDGCLNQRLQYQRLRSENTISEVFLQYAIGLLEMRLERLTMGIDISELTGVLGILPENWDFINGYKKWE